MIRALVLRDRQHTRALALPLLRRLTRHLLEHELGVTDYELCFHFVDPEEMARVNQQFLQHEGSTDVITFDYGELEAPISGVPKLHGEIFISVADAVKQAKEFRTTWQAELARYTIHALLHLRGYDDLQPAARKLMKREENRLLQRVSAKFSVSDLTRTRNSKPETRKRP